MDVSLVSMEEIIQTGDVFGLRMMDSVGSNGNR